MFLVASLVPYDFTCFTWFHLFSMASFVNFLLQCRIMRDMTQVNSQGVGKSRGFAFINFTEHAHALQALRSTNNSPEIFGEKKVSVMVCM